MSPPLPPAPAEDVDLDAIFQALVTGVTGLDGTLVRPRWQPVVPKQPEPAVTWCAIGVMVQTADDGPSLVHNPEGDGSDTYLRHESIEVLASFYGPLAQQYASLFRDGIAIQQNTESLSAVDIRWIECGTIRQMPELVNQQWIRRSDIALRFRRKITRVYGTLSIEIAEIHLFDDTNVSDTIVVPPGSPLEP